METIVEEPIKPKVVLETREPVQFFRENEGYTLSYPVFNPLNLDDPFVVIIKSHEEGDKRRKSTNMHTKAHQFLGKRVRVTVEALD